MNFLIFTSLMFFLIILHYFKKDDRLITYGGLIVLMSSVIMSENGITELSFISISIISIPVLIKSRGKLLRKEKVHVILKYSLAIFFILSAAIVAFSSKTPTSFSKGYIFNDYDKSYLILCSLFLLASLLFEIKKTRRNIK